MGNWTIDDVENKQPGYEYLYEYLYGLLFLIERGKRGVENSRKVGTSETGHGEL
jgi:hypothetical protein